MAYLPSSTWYVWGVELLFVCRISRALSMYMSVTCIYMCVCVYVCVCLYAGAQLSGGRTGLVCRAFRTHSSCLVPRAKLRCVCMCVCMLIRVCLGMFAAVTSFMGGSMWNPLPKKNAPQLPRNLFYSIRTHDPRSDFPTVSCCVAVKCQPVG